MHLNTPAIYFMIILGVLPGCIGIPTQEMSDARQAVQAAQDSGAAERAPHNLNSAENFLNKAKQELEAGSYAEARRSALEAKRQAIIARNATLGNGTPLGSEMP